MKKIVLTMVALMTMSLSYAETKSVKSETNVENIDRFFVKNHDTRFDINVDMRRLATTLDLNDYQMEAVEVIMNNFIDDMQSAGEKWGPYRRHLVHQAVSKDVRQMQRVLNDKQFDTYMTLLGATLRNKGL